MKQEPTKAVNNDGISVEAARRKRAASAKFQKLCALSRAWQAQIDARWFRALSRGH